MMDAKDANLNSKDQLKELELEWNDEMNTTSDESLEENVLEYLRPNEELKRLMIKSYGGQLPRLTHLGIMKMQQVKHVDTEFIGKGKFEGFPALETLILEDTPQWVEWLTTQEDCYETGKIGVARLRGSNNATKASITLLLKIARIRISAEAFLSIAW
ncbi:hypothetical protein Q3G72_029960 [Acer saccharum]|nr:hypothetical protein Q3G72_029960 [Acer saccharum]